MTLRPTPPTLLSTNEWQYADDSYASDAPISPSSAYIVDSPSSLEISPATVPPQGPHPLSREASEDDSSFISDSGQFHSAARSPKLPSLPDPSQYPDPYPSYRPPHWHHGLSTPTLSSADSSTASTRSSAYTNSARSGDYGHVHVALGNEDSNFSMGISTDDVAQLLAREVGTSASLQQSRKSLTDQGRWSDLYAQSVRSRSSSVGNRKGDASSEVGSPPLRATPSFDQAWASVDERDELGMTSEEDMDDDLLIDEEDEPEDMEEEVTSAMMIAEEGRGIIVRGDDIPIVQVQVQPGTTHLLIGSSSTPNSVPQFLTNNIPSIATTLLCLDISANFLGALPPVLQACTCLEELNIASNPLRALPIFLAGLTSLRVLIADATGLTTLPPNLSSLEKLHTLSIRRNKMNSLPSWLCLLPSLETLLVDGNPFQGPWKALVEPLLAKVPMSPLYPPSTPVFPLPSASLTSMQGTATDDDDTSDPPSPENDRAGTSPEDEDTIMPPRAPPVSRSVTSPVPLSQRVQAAGPLSRTRTTPNKAYFDKYRAPSKSIVGSGMPAGPSNAGGNDLGERELRKMKSAGELRRSPIGASHNVPTSSSATASPQRPQLTHYATSASSSNLLAASPPHDSQAVPKRFASLGAASALSPEGVRQRPPIDAALWGNTSPDKSDFSVRNVTPAPADNSVDQPLMGSLASRRDRDSRYTPPPQARNNKEESKSSRWGFLKKMSMGKMRDSPPPPKLPTRTQAHPQSRPVTMARSVSAAAGGLLPHMSPQIDVRISTTGALLQVHEDHTLSRKPSEDLLKSPPLPEFSLSPSDNEMTQAPKSPTSGPMLSPTNLLMPTGSTPRSAKRRSFLPIEMTPIPIPAASAFMSDVTVTSDSEDYDATARAVPSPIQIATMEQIQRREEEKAREARTRALRSVMAYLRDMHDLGLMQTTPTTTSIYGSIGEAPGTRSRRPTLVENGRMASEGSVISMASSSTSSPQLRSSESRNALRSGSTTLTNSVATTASTDSNGSAGTDERKYKDDKGKRAMILKEIVETERTYVKGLQELADIYIKPAAAPVTVLGGLGQTVVPAAERKIVFSGLEALFSFHKESFLPALEKATAPIRSPGLAEADADGKLSLDVARAVAQIFVSHAAFMKMYSTYINNFDNSVQRIKAWVSDKPANNPMSPPSSTAQLAGLGLTMSAVTAPTTMTDANNTSNNSTPLTSGQKKRIKAYLKRCRMNPRHSQLNLEGYLLLPVQRIPRYRLLLEELMKSCPPMLEYMEDPLDRALAEISSLAMNMNEGKREAETRRKLVQWQARIRGKFPSPLVQPHRRLIMDGPLHLTRVVRKATVSFEVIDSKGDASTVQVECLSPELTPRSLIGVLCNDLLVLCRDPSEGQDPNSQVDLWAVLRMQTLPQPASIVHGNALRLVDNKAILYFDAPSTSDALTWFRAINLHIPASKA